MEPKHSYYWIALQTYPFPGFTAFCTLITSYYNNFCLSCKFIQSNKYWNKYNTHIYIQTDATTQIQIYQMENKQKIEWHKKGDKDGKEWKKTVVQIRNKGVSLLLLEKSLLIDIRFFLECDKFLPQKSQISSMDNGHIISCKHHTNLAQSWHTHTDTINCWKIPIRKMNSSRRRETIKCLIWTISKDNSNNNGNNKHQHLQKSLVSSSASLSFYLIEWLPQTTNIIVINSSSSSSKDIINSHNYDEATTSVYCLLKILICHCRKLHFGHLQITWE